MCFGLSKKNDGDTGWYVGANLDMVLTKDTWGMLPGTWALGEIGVEFKRFSSKKVTQTVPSTCFAIAGSASREWEVLHSRNGEKSANYHADSECGTENHVHGRQSVSSVDYSRWVGFSRY